MTRYLTGRARRAAPLPTVMIAVAALSGVLAAALFLRRSRSASDGIDPLRDRWDGEGAQPFEDDVVVPS
jgi:hypothetical protein